MRLHVSDAVTTAKKPLKSKRTMYKDDRIISYREDNVFIFCLAAH